MWANICKHFFGFPPIYCSDGSYGNCPNLAFYAKLLIFFIKLLLNIFKKWKNVCNFNIWDFSLRNSNATRVCVIFCAWPNWEKPTKTVEEESSFRKVCRHNSLRLCLTQCTNIWEGNPRDWVACRQSRPNAILDGMETHVTLKDRRSNSSSTVFLLFTTLLTLAVRWNN